MHDAVTGRFLSPDITIPNPGLTQSYNRYAYVNNNPLSFIDPSGFTPESRGGCNPETPTLCDEYGFYLMVRHYVESECRIGACSLPGEWALAINMFDPYSINWEPGLFRNGVMTDEFASYIEYIEEEYTLEHAGPPSLGDRMMAGAADAIGKMWNLPNTMVGLLVGGLGRLAGGDVERAHNAIEFRNSAAMNIFGEYGRNGALTLGNTIIYGIHGYRHAPHEEIHTYQGQFLGPAYIPLNLIGMTLSALSYPIRSLRRPNESPVHGRLNFMEGAPTSNHVYGEEP